MTPPPRPLRRIDGRALRAAREQRGLKKSQVADPAGLTRPFYGRLEKGERHTSKFETVATLAAVLGVSVEQITRPVVVHDTDAAAA